MENHRREIEKHFGVGRKEKETKDVGNPIKTHSSEKTLSPQGQHRKSKLARNYSSHGFGEVKEEEKKEKKKEPRKGFNNKAFHSSFEGDFEPIMESGSKPLFS